MRCSSFRIFLAGMAAALCWGSFLCAQIPAPENGGPGVGAVAASEAEEGQKPKPSSKPGQPLKAGGAPAAGQPAKVAWLIPDMELSQAKLSEVVDFLRDQTGASIVISTEVKDREVPYLNLQNVSARTVLEALCQTDTGLALREQVDRGDDVFHLVNRMPGEPSPVPAEPVGDEKTGPVDFPGGTLMELQLLLHSKLEANVVIPVESAKTKVPALRLRKVSAVGALRAALIGAGSNLEVTRLTAAQDGKTVQVLRAFPPPLRVEGLMEEQRVVHVFTLPVPPALTKRIGEVETKRDAVQEAEAKRTAAQNAPEREALMQADDRMQRDIALFMEETRRSVTTAVSLQRKMRGQGSTDLPELDVHWGTKIIIVTGREADMNIVAEVMAAMGGTPVGEKRTR